MSVQVERSYLEISSINELLVKNKPFSDLYLEKVNPPDFQLNKFFYKEIGKIDVFLLYHDLTPQSRVILQLMR